MRNRRWVRQIGFSFLEYAVTLPILLVGVLGAVDTANYFRVHGALKEGVDRGLRCLYPTDGDCVDVDAPDTIPQNDLYVPPFLALKRDYDGRERHLILPNYSFGDISATVLSGASFDLQTQRYGIKRDLLNGVGTIGFFRLEKPTLSGLIRDATINGGVSRATKINSPHGNRIATCSAGSKTIYEATFDVGAPELAGDPNFNRMNDCVTVGGNQLCDINRVKEKADLYLVFKGNGFVYREAVQPNQPHVFHSPSINGHINVRGTYRLPGDNEDRELETSASTYPGTGDWNLGGQAFNGTEYQNFYPRGFNWSDASHLGDAGDAGEAGGAQGHFNKHHKIRAPYNSTVTIRFELESRETQSSCHPNLDIGWEMTSAKVVIPKFSITTENLPCRGAQPRSVCGGGCAIQAEQSQFAGIQGLSFGPTLSSTCIGSPVAFDDFRQSPSCFEQQPDIVSVAQQSGVQPGKEGDYSWNGVNSDGCEVHAGQNQGCPANFGVSSPSQWNGTQRYVTYSDEAVSACPIPQNAIPNSVRWYEQDINVWSAGISVPESDCSIQTGSLLPAQHYPAQVVPYKKLILPHAVVSGSTPSYRVLGNPTELKQLSQFACPEVTIGQTNFGEPYLTEFEEPLRTQVAQSLFVGPQRQLGCGTFEALRQEAIRLGTNPNAFFEVLKDSDVSGSDYLISVGEIDACKVVRADTSLVSLNLRSKVPGGPFDEGVTPGQCLVQGIDHCIKIPAGLRTIEGSEKFAVLNERVIEKAQRAIKAYMPNARNASECETDEVNCVKVQLGEQNLNPTFDPLKDPFTLRASARIPMALFFNRGSLSVNYVAERDWEGKYAN